MFTVAFGTTAPFWSVTTPVIEPVLDCPKAPSVVSKMIAGRKANLMRFFIELCIMASSKFIVLILLCSRFSSGGRRLLRNQASIGRPSSDRIFQDCQQSSKLSALRHESKRVGRQRA